MRRMGAQRQNSVDVGLGRPKRAWTTIPRAVRTGGRRAPARRRLAHRWEDAPGAGERGATTPSAQARGREATMSARRRSRQSHRLRLMGSARRASSQASRSARGVSAARDAAIRAPPSGRGQRGYGRARRRGPPPAAMDMRLRYASPPRPPLLTRSRQPVAGGRGCERYRATPSLRTRQGRTRLMTPRRREEQPRQRARLVAAAIAARFRDAPRRSAVRRDEAVGADHVGEEPARSRPSFAS